MLRRIVMTAIVALALGALPTAAQPPAGTQQTRPAEQPGGRVGPPPPAEATGLNFNIKLDLTITDQSGPGEPLKKIVTMIVADRGTGSIRSSGSVRAQGRVQINVDARPSVLNNTNLIRLQLGLEYNPRTLGQDAPTEWSSLNEQLSLVLQPGKPLVVSQAADPASDRRITVEVLATILK